MQKFLMIGLVSLILVACGGNTQPTAETQEEEQTQVQTNFQNLSKADLLGLYTAGGHDESWAVSVDESNGIWLVKGAEVESMLPPLDEIFNYPEDFPFDYFETFELDEEQKTFTSDWGKGKFEQGRMIFEEKEGLQLAKNELSYTRTDLVGFYRGSTWHSQGFVIFIEEKDGQLKVKGSQTDGGEPTRSDIIDDPDTYRLATFTTFEFNETNTAFKSNWGKGRIQNGPSGLTLVFAKLPGSYDPGEDKSDIQVRLYKVE